MVLVPEFVLLSESSNSILEFVFCILGQSGQNEQSAEASTSGTFIIWLIL